MNNNLPTISVVTVCYNCKDSIKETLLSVIKQDYPNIEYIIIDGASTDGTTDLIKTQIKNQTIKTKFISEPDNGIYDAMNKGLLHVSGDWTIFMNGGDKFASLSVLSNIFHSKDEYNEFDVLYGDIIQKYKELGSFHRSYANSINDTNFGNVCHQATFVRSNQWKKVGFSQNFKICADMESLKNIYNNGGKFLYIPVIIAEFDQTDGASAFEFIGCFYESVRLNDIKKFSKEWIWGYVKAISKQLIFSIISKKNFVKLRYFYLKKKLSS